MWSLWAPPLGVVVAIGILLFCGLDYLMWTPEIARAMMSRWISEVPSKIV